MHGSIVQFCQTFTKFQRKRCLSHYVFFFFTFFTDLPRPTLTVTPDSPVFTGETVNLTCVIKPDHSDWTYEWYKGTDSVMLQTSDR